jgi:hypothetical protein
MTRKLTGLLSVLAALALLAGCATKVTGVRQAEGFTFDAVIAGKMAIGGVYSNFEDLTDQEKSRHATNLRIAIQEKQSKYEVTPMPELRNRYGKEEFEKIMQEFRVDGILSTEAVAKLRSKSPERYVALVRIEEDQKGEAIWRQVSGQQATQERSATVRGRTKTVETTRTVSEPQVVVTRARTLKVTGAVYDLKDGKKVWDGLVTTTRTNRLEYPISKAPGGLAALARALSGTPEPSDKPKQEIYPPPDAPSLFELLPEAYEGFAKALPS